MKKRSYTYELRDERDLLYSVKTLLSEGGAGWKEIGAWMMSGHVEYQPLKTNPMRSGYQYQYQKAGLNMTLYFPEKIFNQLLDTIDKERLLKLKSAFQQAIPERSGYIIQEFKIKGIMDEPGPEA